jgi:hypothetical protein
MSAFDQHLNHQSTVNIDSSFQSLHDIFEFRITWECGDDLENFCLDFGFHTKDFTITDSISLKFLEPFMVLPARASICIIKNAYLISYLVLPEINQSCQLFFLEEQQNSEIVLGLDLSSESC